jgi:hypothetical protein
VLQVNREPVYVAKFNRTYPRYDILVHSLSAHFYFLPQMLARTF